MSRRNCVQYNLLKSETSTLLERIKNIIECKERGEIQNGQTNE